MKPIVLQLDRLLQPLGFVREKTTWNRRADSCVDVLDIQKSKAGDSVTINFGVLDIDVHRKFWGSEPPEFVEQPLCTVGVRIGELIDDKDKWWQLDENGVADDIAGKVLTLALPFIERMHTRAVMKRWLIDTGVTKKNYPPPIINLAILMNLLNEAEHGCDLLAEIAKKSTGAWRTRATEIAGRLRCQHVDAD